MTTARPVVLVTGAGSGIGRDCAITLAADGHHVIVADRDGRLAESTAHDIVATGGEGESFTCDVTDSRAVTALVESIVADHGRLDGAVNNAGISGARVGIADLGDDEWVETRSIDLDGVLYCVRAEVRAMRALGGGSIVNMASILSTVAYPRAAAYVTAKHGVLGITRSAALDYATDGIRVNAVGPGFIDVDRHRDLPDDARDELISLHPLGQLGTPEDVAHLVSFLISPRSRNITGAFVPTDGGFTIR